MEPVISPVVVMSTVCARGTGAAVPCRILAPKNGQLSIRSSSPHVKKPAGGDARDKGEYMLARLVASNLNEGTGSGVMPQDAALDLITSRLKQEDAHVVMLNEICIGTPGRIRVSTKSQS